MKNTTNKLTGRQLSAMLLISDAFALFCFRGGMSAATAAGLSAGILLQFILALPLALRQGGLSSGEQGFYAVYHILWGGMLFDMQWNTSGELYIPYESSGGIWGKLFISGLIGLVCIYISSVGIKAAARASLIAAAAGGICIAIVVFSALRSPDWGELGRTESGRSVCSEIQRGFAMSGGLGGLAVLLPGTKGKKLQNIAGYFAAKLVMTVIIVLTTVLVTGGIADITGFPAVRAAQLSQPFPSQRIDSLFMIVFTVYAVFSIGIQAASAAYMIGDVFPAAERYAGGVSVVLMTGAAFMLSGLPLYSFWTAALVITALFAVPVIRLICDKIGITEVRTC
ncbi:MAG: hypothetical protein GXY08_06510 [Ruminococcus sp.]|nr:hypothetical protein [Ruminococcus sp.]